MRKKIILGINRKNRNVTIIWFYACAPIYNWGCKGDGLFNIMFKSCHHTAVNGIILNNPKPCGKKCSI